MSDVPAESTPPLLRYDDRELMSRIRWTDVGLAAAKRAGNWHPEYIVAHEMLLWTYMLEAERRGLLCVLKS